MTSVIQVDVCYDLFLPHNLKSHIMKNKIILAIFIVFSAITSSCKKEDNSSSNNNTSSNISANITSGLWRVSYYHESSNDHTSNFNGYTFSFSNTGTMTATNSAGSTSGTWSIDDSNANEFHMSIGSTSPLTDLNSGWLITSQSSTQVELRDDSGNHSEELHFTKI
jgi:hypothetical protein